MKKEGIETEEETKNSYRCPDCGSEMGFEGYRPLFPTCGECGKSFHLEECVRSDE